MFNGGLTGRGIAAAVLFGSLSMLSVFAGAFDKVSDVPPFGWTAIAIWLSMMAASVYALVKPVGKL